MGDRRRDRMGDRRRGRVGETEEETRWESDRNGKIWWKRDREVVAGWE